jgi:hypothetical protein
MVTILTMIRVAQDHRCLKTLRYLPDCSFGWCVPEPKSFLFFNLWTIFWVLPVCNLLTSVIFYVWCYLLTSCFSCVSLNSVTIVIKIIFSSMLLQFSCTWLLAGFVCYLICVFCSTSLSWLQKYDTLLSNMHIICQHHT